MEQFVGSPMPQVLEDVVLEQKGEQIVDVHPHLRFQEHIVKGISDWMKEQIVNSPIPRRSCSWWSAFDDALCN